MNPQPTIPNQTPATATPSVDPSTFGNYSDWAAENMAKGVSADSLKQTLAQQGINTTGTSAAASTPSNQGNSGNFFTSLLPTIGSVGVPLLATLLAPGTGGLSLVGGALLSGLGGAVGKGAQNALEGKNITSGLGSEALLDTVAGGAGGILGKIGSKILSPIGKTAGTTAEKLIAGQAPKGAISPELAHTLRTSGITNINTGKDFSSILSGDTKNAKEGQALINQAYESHLKDLDALTPNSVNISDITQLTGTTPSKQSLAALQLSSSGNTTQDLANLNKLTDREASALRTELNGLGKPYNLDVGGQTSQANALQLQRDLAKRADTYSQKYISSNKNDLSAGKFADVYNDLSNLVRGRITGLNDVVPPEVKQSLADDILRYGSSVNKTAAQTVADQIKNAGDITYSELRSIASPWVNTSKAADLAAGVAAKNFGTTPGQAFQSVLPITGAVAGMGGAKAAGGAALGAAIGHPGANSALAGILSSVSSKLSSPTLSKILPTLGRLAAITPTNMVANSVENTNTPEALNNINNSYQQEGNMTSDSQNQLSQLINTIMTHPAVYGGQTGSLISSLYPMAQQNAITSNELQALPELYKAAGGGQGLSGIGGLILSMIPGTAQNTYRRQAEAAAAMLGNVTGIPASTASGLTPSLLQNPSSAASSMSILSGLGGNLGTL